MLIMLTIAVFVPVGLGALVLAADRRFNRPGRASRFTLGRYGHLFPNHDEDLRDRLEPDGR